MPRNEKHAPAERYKEVPLPKHGHRFSVTAQSDGMERTQPECYEVTVWTTRESVKVTIGADGRLSVEPVERG